MKLKLKIREAGITDGTYMVGFGLDGSGAFVCSKEEAQAAAKRLFEEIEVDIDFNADDKAEPADPYAGQYMVYEHNKDHTYNGHKVYYSYINYLQESKEICAKEDYPELLEIQVMTIKDNYYKYGQIIDNPKYDPDGTACVCRVKTAAGLGPWVFRYDFGSASYCSANCAYYCSYDVRNNASFRAAVFTGLKKEGAQ